MQQPEQPDVLLSTGIEGLDTLVGGGLTARRIYLIEGEPGAGKTTAGLQFLIEGVRNGESVVYITLAENREELAAVAASHGWTIDGIFVHEVLPDENLLAGADQYTMFHPSEVELAETTKTMLSVVEERQPDARGVRLAVRAAAAGRRRRCATGGRSWRSSSSSRAATARCCCSTTARHRPRRPAGAEHRARRDPARACREGLRRRAAPAARGQVPRPPFRGGYHDYTIRRGGLEVLPAPGRGRARRGITSRRSSSSGLPSSTSCSAAASREAPAR